MLGKGGWVKLRVEGEWDGERGGCGWKKGCVCRSFLFVLERLRIGVFMIRPICDSILGGQVGACSMCLEGGSNCLKKKILLKSN